MFAHLIPRNREQATVAAMLAGLFVASIIFAGGEKTPAPGDTFSDDTNMKIYHYRVDPNRASAVELQTLPGIGEKLAAGILLYQEENGPLRDHEDLLDVRGIGPKRMDAIRPYLLEIRRETLDETATCPSSRP